MHKAASVAAVFDQARLEKRYSPASSFKIPHTLFALDAGVVRDEFQVFRWDGIERSFAEHNQDQVAFLQQLYRNAQPFRVEHQRLDKELMIVEAGRNWTLLAKTGWEGRTGWWVGWVEWPNGPVFFALKIDTPNRLDDLFKREAVARSTLRAIEALPPAPDTAH